MIASRQRFLSLTFCIALLSFAAPCAAQNNSNKSDAQKLPPPAEKTVDFHKDIAPILIGSCVKCHTGAEPKGGFGIETREQLLAGGDSGPAVEVGDSADSYLIHLTAAIDPDNFMPDQGQRLSEEKVGLLRAWIDQGLKWEEGFRFRAPRIAALAPRRVALPKSPPGASLHNPVDLLLAPYFESHGVERAGVVDDHVYIRRAYLDLVGLLPPPEAVADFERDQRADKRRLLVEKLLGDEPAAQNAYAQHWMTFWNDALRNAYRGTGYIDGGRTPISQWLYRSLLENKPYDRFVHELISPVPGSEGFTGGIKWRGVVNASQRREVQAAQNITQVFMGTNLKCASCHDSFINQWTLSDAYGLAAVFADEKLEIHRCNKPTGEFAQVKFMYPELGAIDGDQPKPERMRQLADVIVGPRNGRLTRTIVNRLWARLFGRGIVEPLDDMDQAPWSEDLLDWLAVDLAENGYDLKRTLAMLCTSRAYQMPSVGAPRPDAAGFAFRGPVVKRLTAEQFVDAVSTLTGQWPQQPAINVSPPGGDSADVAARWIWSVASAASAAEGGRVYFRKRMQFDQRPRRFVAAIACDNEFSLYLNGARVAGGDNWQAPVVIDLAARLTGGDNVIAVEAINWPDKQNPKRRNVQAPNPAGFIFAALIQDAAGAWRAAGSDATWQVTSAPVQGWQRPRFDDSQWSDAADLGPASLSPWKLQANLGAALAARADNSIAPVAGVRAVLVNDDVLTRALGRPNREQVVTRRDSIATTLQAIELTNGETLDVLLNRGAEAWLAKSNESAADLVEQIYLTALARKPGENELAAAIELAGRPADREGVADLLWIVAMLPEFQLIY